MNVFSIFTDNGKDIDFRYIEHPRFGLTQGVFIKPGIELKAGSEIFVNYGYKQEQAKFPHDYPWYYKMKAKVDKERRVEEIRYQQNEKNKKKPKKAKKKI